MNECFVKLSLKSTLSTAMMLLLMITIGSVSAQPNGKQNYALQGTVISAVDKKHLQVVSVRVEAENVKISTKKDGSFQHRCISAHRQSEVHLCGLQNPRTGSYCRIVVACTTICCRKSN